MKLCGWLRKGIWSAIIGMRNNLIHGYNEVDYEIVWDAAQNDLEGLEDRIVEILSGIKLPADFESSVPVWARRTGRCRRIPRSLASRAQRDALAGVWQRAARPAESSGWESMEDKMPTIASFENIDVKMQKEGGAQHKKSHIYAYYGEQSASFDIASYDLIVGELPLRELRLVQGWIELHRDELNIEWKTLEAGGKWFTIAGLR